MLAVRSVKEKTSANDVISLANRPTTPRERRSALVVIALILVITLVAAPIADTPLPRLDAFIPILASTLFITSLITAVLLFSQFSIVYSYALLVLASGYLFVSLIVIPFALSFPGVFSPSGLLSANPETPAWLYNFWHLGFSLAVCGYVFLIKVDSFRPHSPAPSRIYWSVAVVTCLVCVITLSTTTGITFFPRQLQDANRFSTLARVIIVFNILATALAFVLLWTRRHTALNQWLLVALGALMSELILTGLLVSARFSLGWYAGRLFSLVTSTAVLTVLLAQTTRLYGRVALSNTMLERERQNKLMNIQAATASIAHEVRQPLAAITTNAAAARRWLKRVPPDVGRVENLLNDIERAGFRASEVLTNVRRLFQEPGHEQLPIDVNSVALETLQILHGELTDHGVKTNVELTSELPLVMGHRTQLQEVFLNLVKNAIDAMVPTKIDRRVLKVRTKPDGAKTIIIEVEDSGQGIEPEHLDRIFDAFHTTKTNGTGLGLAICSRIIERHGGQLTASSDGKNGALFQIVLPVEPRATPNAE